MSSSGFACASSTSFWVWVLPQYRVTSLRILRPWVLLSLRHCYYRAKAQAAGGNQNCVDRS
jgi:hypothetical protein